MVQPKISDLFKSSAPSVPVNDDTVKRDVVFNLSPTIEAASSSDVDKKADKPEEPSVPSVLEAEDGQVDKHEAKKDEKKPKAQKKPSKPRVIKPKVPLSYLPITSCSKTPMPEAMYKITTPLTAPSRIDKEKREEASITIDNGGGCPIEISYLSRNIEDLSRVF